MNEKIKILEQWYAAHPKLLVAFSGGVDSCLVAFLGRKFLGRENAVACISKSPGLKRRDLELARQFAEQYDLKLMEIETDELSNPGYAENPANRCYFCKNTLYQHMHSVIEDELPGYEIANGNNHNDLGDYRPGMDAARDQQALSPFVECGITKADIREMARHFDLFTWEKPASPCLSSRFPYGQHITREKLAQVEAAEELILAKGIAEVRVRHFDTLARVEVPAKSLDALKAVWDDVSEQIKALGFEACEIDEEGLVSGKMNRELNLG